MLEIGSIVDGKYKILNKVGQGGMSVVYLAMNEKANKQWAVKEVRKDGIKDFEIVRQGLVAETNILKKLSHPNLPSIADIIDTEDSFIIVMDYIQGNSLNKVIDEYGAQPQDNVISWAKQLCDVLEYLHTRSPAIIYRDMKPANVMLKPDGNVMLIDFGTAREFKDKNLADTTCLGTVGYAAPEQFGGMGQTDARTDIYCLGATLYHLVTGMNPCKPPYEIKPIREINPILSSGFEKIIQKCTQRDPNDRYQSAAELMYALDHYEEIDDRYRKKQKGKLARFLVCVILTIICAATSAWGYIAAENKKSENYDYILASAATIDDYFNAILTDPTRTEAYLGNDENSGLIEFVLDDNKLTREEGAIIDKLKVGLEKTNSSGYSSTVNVLEDLKKSNPDGYQDVCYRFGEAYLFYYEVESDAAKYKSSRAWFNKAVDKYPIAEDFSNIADCLNDIAKSKTSDNIEKKKQAIDNTWNKLSNLQNSLKENKDEYDFDTQIRIIKAITRIVDTYAEDFINVQDKEVKNITTSLLFSLVDLEERYDGNYYQPSLKEARELINSTSSKLDLLLKSNDKTMNDNEG